MAARYASLLGGGPRTGSGSLAKFAAIRRASSSVSRSLTVLRCGSSSK